MRAVESDLQSRRVRVMKQESAKHTVAWFKIAEFVSRGEKERALALYRLLAHAIDDPAFVQQLEGDILLSFNDDAAFEHYAVSAQLYAKQGKSSEAAAVYEHLITLAPASDEKLQTLIDLYKQLPKVSRTYGATQLLLRNLMSRGQFEKVSTALQQLDEVALDFGMIHQELVAAWLNEENPPTEPLKLHVKKIIDFYFQAKQQKALQTFLMTLKMLHALLYQEACFYMQDNNTAAR